MENGPLASASRTSARSFLEPPFRRSPGARGPLQRPAAGGRLKSKRDFRHSRPRVPGRAHEAGPHPPVFQESRGCASYTRGRNLKHMKALVLREYGKFSYDEIPVSTDPARRGPRRGEGVRHLRERRPRHGWPTGRRLPRSSWATRRRASSTSDGAASGVWKPGDR